MELAAMLRREIGGDAAGRTVHDDRPFPAREDMIGTHSQRQFFADVAAGVVHDGQPIRIRVLSETDIGTLRRHGRHQ